MAAHSVSYRYFRVTLWTLKSWMVIYLYMWASCCFNTSVTGQHQVIGSSQAVLAKVGDEAILPCHIEPPVNMERRVVEWLRPDLKPQFVLILRDGLYLTEEQNPLYKERTSLFHEKLSHGNISLKLSGVKLSDEGTYQCFVPDLNSSSTIQLLVGAVSQPVISSIGPKDGGLSLTCDSGCWYPEPEMSWLDGDENNITAEPSVTLRPSQQCYNVQRNVTVTQAGLITCRVHLPHIKHHVDSRQHIPERDIPTDGGSTGGRARTVIVIPVIFNIMVSTVLLFLYWKQKLTKPDPTHESGAADQELKLITGHSGNQKDDTPSPKPRPRNRTSQRWNKPLEKLANIDDCEVINVGSFVIGKKDEFHIGKGNNGTEVYLGLRDDGTEVAVKKMTTRYVEALEKEKIFSSLPKLVDPSIVQYVDFAKDENFGYLALQLCEYNLKYYIKEHPDKNSLSELQRKQLACQVLQSLRFLHGRGPPILHGAIKPQNVLIDTVGNARLADFGIIPQPQQTSRGTWTQWVPTEQAMGEDCAYTILSDIQVAGMLIYYILSGGEHPFGTGLLCQANIHDGIYNLDRVQDEVAKNLIEWMINADPDKRPSVEECLAHPFFWSNERRVEYLRRIGNQQEVVDCPDDDLIRALDQYAEQGQFNAWKHKFEYELVQKMDGMQSYPDNSFGLLHCIYNLHEHYAEDAAHIDLMEMFPGLVGGVYKFAQKQDWNSRPNLQDIIQREHVGNSAV